MTATTSEKTKTLPAGSKVVPSGLGPGRSGPGSSRWKRASSSSPRNWLLWGGVGLVALIAAAVGVFLSPLLAVNRVEVSGVEGEAAEQVISEMEVLDTPMVLADPGKLSERAANLAWVAHVDVEKDWPRKLTAEVVTHRPIALVSNPSGSPESFVLTATGDRIPLGEAGPLEPFFDLLPTVALAPTGSDASAEATQETLMELVAMIGTLGPRSSEMLIGAELDSESNLELLVGGIPTVPSDSAEGTDSAEAGDVEAGAGPSGTATVRFGGLSNLAEKAIAVEAALGGSMVLDCMATLDVSVPSRIVVTRHPGCALPELEEPGDSADSAAGDLGTGDSATDTGEDR